MSKPIKSVIAPLSRNMPSMYKGHLFIRNIPSLMKSEFKSACAKKGATMRDVMMLFMQKYSTAVKKEEFSIKLSELAPYRDTTED